MRPRRQASSAAGSSRQGKRREARVQRLRRRVRERGQQVVGELAPAELAQEGAGGAPQARRLLRVPVRRGRARPRPRARPRRASRRRRATPGAPSARPSAGGARAASCPRGRGGRGRRRSRRARPSRKPSRRAARPPRPAARRRRTRPPRAAAPPPPAPRGRGPRGSAGAGGSARGAGRGSSGAPAARRARQNGVKTVYGRPSRVRTESGSASRFAWGATTASIPRAASAASQGVVVGGLVRLEAARPHHGVGARLAPPARPRRRPGRRAPPAVASPDGAGRRPGSRASARATSAPRRRGPRRGAPAVPTRRPAGVSRRRPRAIRAAASSAGLSPSRRSRRSHRIVGGVICRGRSRSSGLLGRRSAAALARGRVVMEYDRRRRAAIAAAALASDGRETWTTAMTPEHGPRCGGCAPAGAGWTGAPCWSPARRAASASRRPSGWPGWGRTCSCTAATPGRGAAALAAVRAASAPARRAGAVPRRPRLARRTSAGWRPR